MTRSARLLACSLALVVAGCGSSGDATPDGGEKPRSDRLVDFTAQPPFVNALDIEPESGDFLLTTNKGFWKIGKTDGTVTQIKGTIAAGGKSDTVGTFLEIEVTPDGKLIGSGHPDNQNTLPQFLGFIESDDSGKSWSVLSRLGDADLHKIVQIHGKLYAFDAVLSALLISDDGGKTFTERFTPTGLIIDFVVDPKEPDYILAATEDTLHMTSDQGENWRPVAPGTGVRLEWTEKGLYRADADGTVLSSTDRGMTWNPVGEVEGEPYKFKSDGDTLYLALSDGSILQTLDGGKTWEDVFPPVIRAAAVALALLVLPAAASAHSVVTVQGADVSYTSEDVTSDNDLTIDEVGSEIRFYDPQADAGIQSTQCRPGRVDAAGNPIEVFCPKSGVRNVNVDLGPNEDKLTANLGFPLTATGGSGADVLASLGTGADVLVGDQGNDTLAGGPGADTLNGGEGNDTLRGEAGDDRLQGSAGTDVLDAGEGNDALASRDGLEDRLICGAGTDTAEADSVDNADVSCETVGRMFVTAPDDQPAADDRTRPKLAVGGSTVQRLSARRPRIYVAATSSERGEIAASGYVDLANARIALKSRAAPVTVARAEGWSLPCR